MKGVEKSCSGLIRVMIPKFFCKDKRQARKFSVRVFATCGVIWTRYLLETEHVCFDLYSMLFYVIQPVSIRIITQDKRIYRRQRVTL